MPRILGLSGSLRADSLNTRLLRLAAEGAGDAAELVLFEGLADVPPYDEDVEDAVPAAVAELRDAILAADAVLFATPEYNGSIPGQLKNAIDWLSRQAVGAPLRGKPVAVIGTSTGQFGGVWAQAELRKVLGIAGARVAPVELAVAKGQHRLAEPDEALLAEVQALVEGLVQAGEQAAVAVAA